MHVLPDHNTGPQAKPNRRMLILGGVGVAALLILFLARGRGAASQQPPAAPAATDPTQGQGSTFADNGGQATQLGNDVTGALGGFQSSIDQLTAAVQGMQPGTGGASDTSAPANPNTPVVVNVGGAQPPTVQAAAATGGGSPAGKPKPSFSSVFKQTGTSGRVHHVYTDTKGEVTRDVGVGPRLPVKPAGSPAGGGKKRHH